MFFVSLWGVRERDTFSIEYENSVQYIKFITIWSRTLLP